MQSKELFLKTLLKLVRLLCSRFCVYELFSLFEVFEVFHFDVLTKLLCNLMVRGMW